jgi:serine/threonine-protein kinase RsbW
MTRNDSVRLAVDLAHIATVRHAVREFAAGNGLPERPRSDFVLAVNELVTNAVQHGGGRGGVRLWRTAGALWCEVSDQGPGIPPNRLDRRWLPPATASGGRGLWLVGRLCDDVAISTSDRGTTVRVVKNLP